MLRHVMCLGALALVLACSNTGSSSSSSSSSSGAGGGCVNHIDCPDGYACRLRVCQTSCTSNTPLTGGCVVGATCDNGRCVKPTTCSETQRCAYDKGEVCRLSSSQCVTATTTCDEATSPSCANGFKCDVKVCHEDCKGSAGCADGKTCQNGACR